MAAGDECPPVLCACARACCTESEAQRHVKVKEAARGEEVAGGSPPEQRGWLKPPHLRKLF